MSIKFVDTKTREARSLVALDHTRLSRMDKPLAVFICPISINTMEENDNLCIKF